MRAGGDRHGSGRAAFHARAQEADVAKLYGRDVLPRLARVFLHGQRLACEAGLDDEQVLRVSEVGQQVRTAALVDRREQVAVVSANRQQRPEVGRQNA